MPHIAALELDVNPSAEPLRYPGALVRTSFVMTGLWLYPLEAGAGGRIGSWALDIDGGPLVPHGVMVDRLPLEEVLELAGVSSMDERYPVLAIGSNAAPGQLRHKFGANPKVSDLVPLTRATVRGIGIGHSAHVSRAGYVPYTPLAGDRPVERRLSVLWLDNDQLEHLDRTEPNYHRTLISGEDFPLTLESGETLRRYGLYRGRWGVLRPSPESPPLNATTQAEVLRLLSDQPWFSDLVPECRNGPEAVLAALQTDQRRRALVREAMIREHLAGDDDLPERSGDLRTTPVDDAGGRPPGEPAAAARPASGRSHA
jgi:hypothetical protein